MNKFVGRYLPIGIIVCCIVVVLPFVMISYWDGVGTAYARAATNAGMDDASVRFWQEDGPPIVFAFGLVFGGIVVFVLYELPRKK